MNINLKLINMITVNVGDDVELFNGTKGVIDEIDKRVYQFTLKEPYIIWFHLRDVKILNNKIIDNDLLTF